MYSNGKNKAHSGQGHIAGNIVAFLILFVCFAAGIYALSFWSLDNAWLPGLACFALVMIALIVPQHVLGRGDTHANADGE